MSKHKTVKFGDVVRQVKDKVDPQTAGLERYVAGEHMDTDNLHIRRWGEVGDGYLGPAFHMRFQPGQVLYGSRRTYLRKVAVADFEGITANTTYVIEPRDPEVLLPDFLPFVMSTETFHEHSIKQSKGSVNPYINFSDIAWYEFPLPPVDEQRRIADLLWAADDAFQEYQFALEKLQTATTSFLETQIAEGVKNGWQKVLFDELLTETQYGISKKSGLQREGTVPILGIPNVVAGDTDFSKLAWVEVTDSEFEKYKLKLDDILIVRTNGNPNYVGRCVALKNIPENAVYASYLIRLRVLEERAKPTFIEAVLNSNYMRNTLMKVIRSSAGNYNLNTQGIRNQQIPLPSLDVQDKVMQTLDEFNSSKRALELHIENTKKLKSSLLNKHLSS